MELLPPINKVYLVVVLEESNQKYVIIIEDNSSLMVNAIQRFDHQGKPHHYMNPPRQRTFCNRSVHTLDFCYKKHGQPNFNKNKSQINASTSQNSDVTQAFGTSIEVSSVNTNSNISQAQYDQLVSLLQQVNLLPSANSNNNVSVSTMMLDSSPVTASSSIICTTFNSLTQDKYWILTLVPIIVCASH